MSGSAKTRLNPASTSLWSTGYTTLASLSSGNWTPKRDTGGVAMGGLVFPTHFLKNVNVTTTRDMLW